MTTQGRLLVLVLAGIVASAAVRHRSLTPVHAQSADPCGAALRGHTAAVVDGGVEAPPKHGPLAHDDRWSHLDSLWAHRAALRQHRIAPLSTDARRSQDVGDVAVLRDAGDLVARANPMDLADVAVRLTPNASGGYDVSRAAYSFRTSLGSRVALDDDDTHEAALPFAFPFFGTRHSAIFVNSDGNLTFGAGDVASTERSPSRFLSGPPRIAPFFADLDPSAAGGVLAYADATVFTVTWCGVPAYGSRAAATVQVSLENSGAIEVQVSRQTTIHSAVVGVSPGAATEFTPVDFSANRPLTGTSGALGEQFTTTSALDVVAASQRFLQSHADAFDNLVFFTDTSLLADGAFAYEVSVANAIRGINLPVFDSAAEYGSGGTLQSVCNMDALDKYPDDPFAKFLGENSTVSVIGQEVGHRWLAFLAFRDRNGQRSEALLGRDHSHWSFFFDSDASVLEGNDIEDLGGGSFRTVGAVQRYSLLDQYAMGLVDEIQVPPFFYVENPTNITPRRSSTSGPEVGVTFSGTRRTVTIDDVVAALGRRAPSAAESPRVYRQAFIYVVSAGRTADPAAIQKLDRIRVAWDQFFSAATDSRMRALTNLQR